MIKIKIIKIKYLENLKIRILNLFRISIFEFRILKQRGVSLYLAIMVMTILLAISLGLSAIFLGQTKTIKEMGNSVIAFYAADAGIEKVLMQRTDPLPLDGYSETMANGASFTISVLSSGEGNCNANNFCVKSIGEYKKTRRAIEITY